MDSYLNTRPTISIHKSYAQHSIIIPLNLIGTHQHLLHIIWMNHLIGLFQFHKHLRYINPLTTYFSHTCLAENTWFMHLLLLLRNPYISSTSYCTFKAHPSLLTITLSYSLETTLNRLIPIKLLHVNCTLSCSSL